MYFIARVSLTVLYQIFSVQSPLFSTKHVRQIEKQILHPFFEIFFRNHFTDRKNCADDKRNGHHPKQPSRCYETAKHQKQFHISGSQPSDFEQGIQKNKRKKHRDCGMKNPLPLAFLKTKEQTGRNTEQNKTIIDSVIFKIQKNRRREQYQQQIPVTGQSNKITSLPYRQHLSDNTLQINTMNSLEDTSRYCINKQFELI